MITPEAMPYHSLLRQMAAQKQENTAVK